MNSASYCVPFGLPIRAYSARFSAAYACSLQRTCSQLRYHRQLYSSSYRNERITLTLRHNNRRHYLVVAEAQRDEQAKAHLEHF